MDMDMETNQLSVTISAKEGEKLTFEELTQASDDVIQRISKIKGIKTVGAMAGGDSTMNLMGGGNDSVSMYILLDEDSKVKASDVEEKIVSRTKDLDCKVETNSSSMDYSSYFGSGLSVRIKGNDIDTLQKLAKEVADVMKQTKGTVDVDDGLEDTEPQLTISVDKEKAAEYGYTVAQVYQLVSAKMADSKSATTISTDVKDYKVYVQTEEQTDTKLDDIRQMTFTYTDKEGKEKEIPLTKICEMKDTTTLSTIKRDAQTRYITVRSIEIFAVQEGELDFILDTTHYHLGEGEFIIVNSNEVHAIHANRPNHTIVLQIPLNQFASYFTGEQFIWFSHSERTYDEQVACLIFRMYKVYRMQTDGYDFEILSMFYQLLHILVKKYRKLDVQDELLKSNQQLNRLGMITSYLKDHYMEDISLGKLAGIFGYSPSYLSKMFARYAGINYKDYLQNIRLEHAVKDLENTDKQIVDIAFDHGFANSKAFTNLFRKRYGMLTSEYRKQLVKKKQRESYAHHRALLEKDKKVTL